MSIRRKNESHGALDPWIELLRNNHYPERELESAAEKLARMPEELRRAVRRWDVTGAAPDVEAAGVTLRELTDVFGYGTIAAFLMIDWLRRDPQEARIALAQPASEFNISGEGAASIRKANENDRDDDGHQA